MRAEAAELGGHLPRPRLVIISMRQRRVVLASMRRMRVSVW